ncbi:MAG TPA: response regulator, partial [Dehalococcoidia bacterium]|nr:response regulator [Dehalococcoidia bacterium]
VLVLQDLGCEVLEAPDGETAVSMLSSARPDFVLTDVRLPGIDGVEVTRQIKREKELAKTHVLLMSAFAEPMHHAGDAFLAKPFDIDSLTEFVAPYINNHSG